MIYRLLLGCALCLISCSCFRESFRFGAHSQLERADLLSRQKKYGQAIEAYRQHMSGRLKLKNRPEWENPYFYLLIIGDIELGQGKVEDAHRSYKAAEERGVDSFLVSDRYRSIARWYEQQGHLDKAIEVLNEHRHMDPLLFDSMLDRLAREFVNKEDEKLREKH